jgi:hypothetical protein
MDQKRIKAMQQGRRLAYLKKCIRVQELILEYENNTTVRKQVFEKYVQPEIRCSYTQFNNMLNEVNPKNQIKEILTNKNI